ncbi:hypothetical protein ACA910_022127 [Epithemia clementina (nom. ined.)]
MMSQPKTNVFSRQSLFNAVRGLSFPHRSDSTKNNQCYKHFPLESHHVGLLGKHSGIAGTPEEFHASLCDQIRSAKRRVYLASLYIGPAADPSKSPRESELLNALRQARQNNVDIKILLDLNRALRPIPKPKKIENENAKSTVTSAEACLRAIHTSIAPSTGGVSDPAQIFLLSALTSFWQSILPNPLNEVMGVFHIKAYIFDDNLILSGANLSEEYFVDRHDRYLSIQNGGNGLVDFYADLVNALCANSHAYTNEGVSPVSSTPKQLLESVAKVVMTSNHSGQSEPSLDLNENQTAIVAVAVPTFQAPYRFGTYNRLRYDGDAIQDLIRGASSYDACSCVLRLATAYLNPTNTFLTSCERLKRVHMLTAGQLSHGFKVQKKAGNKGKDWIPSAFREIASSITSKNITVWFYQRPNWTFHAKGLWLALSKGDCGAINQPASLLSLSDFVMRKEDDLFVATHGSGNFGARSEHRDFESNVVLFFPPMSPMAEIHKNEWNEMADCAADSFGNDTKQLSLSFKLLLPFLRSFF